MATVNCCIRSLIIANARLMIQPAIATTKDTKPDELTIVVFGQDNSFVGAVMRGLAPAVEGPSCTTPDLAIRKLHIATCELLGTYIPKLGGHQRNIHGGGVFDEDLIRPELMPDAAKKAS